MVDIYRRIQRKGGLAANAKKEGADVKGRESGKLGQEGCVKSNKSDRI